MIIISNCNGRINSKTQSSPILFLQPGRTGPLSVPIFEAVTSNLQTSLSDIFPLAYCQNRDFIYITIEGNSPTLRTYKRIKIKLLEPLIDVWYCYNYFVKCLLSVRLQEFKVENKNLINLELTTFCDLFHLSLIIFSLVLNLKDQGQRIKLKKRKYT